MADHNTITFSLKNQKDDEMKRTLTEVYNALVEKGYDPLNQIVGYLLSEDPTYITSHNGDLNISIEIPTKLSKSQKQMLEEFEESVELKQYSKMKKYADDIETLYGDKIYKHK